MMDKYLDQLNLINKKVDLDEEFPDWDKRVQFILDDDSGFHFITRDGQVTKVDEGILDRPDVVIKSDNETMSLLFAGKVAIIGGWITQKIKIEGKIGDAIGANVLIQAARVF